MIHTHNTAYRDGSTRDGSTPAADRPADPKQLAAGPLAMLVDGHFDLPELARKTANGDLAALGRWAMQPDTALSLTGLLRLADARTQLALGRYRMIAATMLARIITDQEAGELMRKACVDLLTVDSALAPPPAMTSRATASGAENATSSSSSSSSTPAPVLSPEAILIALERLGREDDSVAPPGGDSV